jgi:hypothetical protein
MVVRGYRQEVVSECWDVFLALAERRQLNAQHVETEK